MKVRTVPKLEAHRPVEACIAYSTFDRNSSGIQIYDLFQYNGPRSIHLGWKLFKRTGPFSCLELSLN